MAVVDWYASELEWYQGPAIMVTDGRVRYGEGGERGRRRNRDIDTNKKEECEKRPAWIESTRGLRGWPWLAK